MIKHSIRYFNNKAVRAVWDYKQSMWWYSAVDFINILVEPNSARRYWNNVKVRNPELSPFCGQLKMFAGDGKKYLSDVINENGVRLLLTIVPWIYAGYMVTIFWQPLFIEKRLADNTCNYDGWIGFFIYVLVFVLSFYLNRKKLRNEFKQWNRLVNNNSSRNKCRKLYCILQIGWRC